MLGSALKQTDCLRGVVMMRVIVRGICFKRSIGDTRVLMARGGVACLRFRLAMLVGLIVTVP